MSNLQLIIYIDPTSRHPERLSIFSELTPHWKKIAMLLDLNGAAILAIDSSGKLPDSCLVQVINEWETKGAPYPYNWKGIYQLLCDSNIGRLAKKLETALNAEISNIRGNYYEGNYASYYNNLSELCELV